MVGERVASRREWIEVDRHQVSTMFLDELTLQAFLLLLYKSLINHHLVWRAVIREFLRWLHGDTSLLRAHSLPFSQLLVLYIRAVLSLLG